MMKSTTWSCNSLRWLNVLILAWLSTAIPSNAAYLILKKDGSRIEGASVHRNSEGDYVIETSLGFQTYPASQITRAEADKPVDFDRAIQLSKSGEALAATYLLGNIAFTKRNCSTGVP